MQRWLRIVPLMAALGVAAIPFWRYGRMAQAHAAGEAFLGKLAAAQLEFRQRHPGQFASAVESLTEPCPGERDPLLDAGAVRAIRERGFVVSVRPAADASAGAPDCHGRPAVTDYYAAIQPASVDAAPRQAYALTGLSGRVFVFFDGLAPLERDMAPGGLATPLDRLGAFKIP